MLNIAFIAHDRKKEELIQFVKQYEHVFQHHKLYATGTTGLRIIQNTSLYVERYRSGPLGGDLQIGSLIVEQQIHFLIFFRDPLMAQPHEPDIMALLRISDVHHLPLATNVATAELMVNLLHLCPTVWHTRLDQKKIDERVDARE